MFSRFGFDKGDDIDQFAVSLGEHFISERERTHADIPTSCTAAIAFFCRVMTACVHCMKGDKIAHAKKIGNFVTTGILDGLKELESCEKGPIGFTYRNPTAMD